MIRLAGNSLKRRDRRTVSAHRFPPIFDGHNDTILSLTGCGFNPLPGGRSFFEEVDNGHVDLPRANKGGLGGGFFAVFVRPPEQDQSTEGKPTSPEEALERATRQFGPADGWPEPMALDYAQSKALELLGRLIQIEKQSNGRCKIVRSATELNSCLSDGTFAILLHFEGTDQLDPDGFALDVFHRAGVQSVGLTHFRKNRYAEGVPMVFPSSPDTGPGLTCEGKELVRQCNARKILVDVSHITEQGFWDVAEITDAPIVATHSNAWVLSNAPRNLTDKQLDAISESKGVAGMNFHVGFLREDGVADTNTPLSVMADHVDYMVERMGIDCVALGSDFDGAVMPTELKDATGLPTLMQTLQDRGYDHDALAKIAHGNWVRVLSETWGE
jgi:membrane dipeptidase